MRTDPPKPSRGDPEPITHTTGAAPVETLTPELGATLAQKRPDYLHLFRQHWRDGQSLPVEEFLAQHPAARDDVELALDLIYAEFVMRQERGAAPAVEAFLERFPGHRGRLELLLSLDRALLSQANGSAEADTLAARVIPEDETAPAPGEFVGKYAIVALLGQGGQARIYRALHPTLQQDVVIKLSLAPFSGSLEDRDCLVQEGRLLAQLDHPHLARVFDLDFHQGRVYLVMEYIPGRTFAQWVEQERPEPGKVAQVLARVARALAAAHARGITHCDLTPRNILIDAQGQPRVIDFGLARLRPAWGDPSTKPETISGTLAFLSPEQARGHTERIGPRTDLFSLGAVLYFTLTGKPLYQGADWPQTLEKARQRAVDLRPLDGPDIPRGLARLCARLLEENPERRPPSAVALADELEALTRPAMPRRKRVAVLGGGIFLVLALLLGWIWWTNREPGQVVSPGDPSKKVVIDDGKPRLTVKVEQEDGFFKLPFPLHQGDRIYVQARVPAHVHASLFLLSSAGKLEHLTDWPAEPKEGTRRFPLPEDQVVPLVGPAGTEVLLLVGRLDHPINLKDLREWWGKESAWPKLPAEAAWRMQKEMVGPLEGKRGVGKPVRGGPDPEAQVETLLEALRAQLRERVAIVEALAFSHEE